MKFLRNFFIAGMLLPGFVFAEESVSFTPPPASPQEYHSVSSDNPALSPVAMLTALPSASAAAAVVNPVDKPAGIDANTQKEVNDLAQNTLGFQQQTNQRIQALVDSNRAMGGAIQSLMQSVTVLEEKAEKESANGALGFLHTPHGYEMEGFFLGVGAILFLGVGILLGRLWRARSRAKVLPPISPMPLPVTTPVSKASEAEYDFMSTSQAIPAKLDLARAYIAMNDLEQARILLKTVIETGDGSQRNEAGQLLEKLVKNQLNESTFLQ